MSASTSKAPVFAIPSKRSNTISALPPFLVYHAYIQGASALFVGFTLLTLSPDHINDNVLARGIAFVTGTLHPYPNVLTNSTPLRTIDPYHAVYQLQYQTLCGLLFIAIGFCYVLALWKGFEQWLYMAVPGRLVVASIGMMVALVAPDRMGWLMLAICVNDAITGLIGAWCLGWPLGGAKVEGEEEEEGGKKKESKTEEKER